MEINIDITAKTNRMWIRLPTEYTKNPNIQPIINITAIKYKMLLMMFVFIN